MKHPGLFCILALALAALPLEPVPAEDQDGGSEISQSTTGTLRTQSRFARDGNTTSTLIVNTDIPKTDIYLNGVYEGQTPKTFSRITAGIWRVSLTKNGYYSESFLIRIRPGETKELLMELVPITGSVLVQNAPPNAVYELDGQRYASPRITATEGSHSLTVKAFGYTEKTHTIVVFRERDTLVDGSLDTAPFRLDSFRARKTRFNPDNPGVLDFTFMVTAPGGGTLKIQDEEGRLITDIPLQTFTTWRQTVSWDGMTDEGSASDGLYTARLVVYPQRTEESQTAEATSTFYIDHSIVHPWSWAFRGIGAIGAVASPSIHPEGEGAFQIDMHWYNNTAHIGFSALRSFYHNLELSGRIAVTVQEDEQAKLAGATHITVALTPGSLKSACAFGYDSSEGLSLVPTLELRLRHLAATVALRGVWGNQYGSLDKGEGRAQAGFSLRSIGSIMSAGIWVLGGTDSLHQKPEDINLTARLSSGLSFQCILPSTNLLISAEASWERDGWGNEGIACRAGFGLIF